jgi:hypothetical protein
MHLKNYVGILYQAFAKKEKAAQSRTAFINYFDQSLEICLDLLFKY